MIISIVRDIFTTQSSAGTLAVITNGDDKGDGLASVGETLFNCFTLEPPQPVAAGMYLAKLEPSPRLSKLYNREIITPRLYGVPGFPRDDVLIHFGNYPWQTEGCVLVGMNRWLDLVAHSDVAFAKMMTFLPPEFQVKLSGAPPTK